MKHVVITGVSGGLGRAMGAGFAAVSWAVGYPRGLRQQGAPQRISNIIKTGTRVVKDILA